MVILSSLEGPCICPQQPPDQYLALTRASRTLYFPVWVVPMTWHHILTSTDFKMVVEGNPSEFMFRGKMPFYPILG